jgi:hypothetical protein
MPAADAANAVAPGAQLAFCQRNVQAADVAGREQEPQGWVDVTQSQPGFPTSMLTLG